MIENHNNSSERRFTEKCHANYSDNELLLCCSRTNIDNKISQRIRGLLQQRVDWDYIIRIATTHQVIPLLYRTFNVIASEKIPRRVFEHLRILYIANAARNLFLTHELFKVLELFQSHDIPIIPYKGPVLAASVYGDIAYRQFTDIDVLVHKLDYHLHVHNLFISNGWQLSKNFGWEKSFRDANGKVEIDVHKSVIHRQMSNRQNFERLWQRCETVSVLNKALKTFSPEYMLIILCVQMYKDISSNKIFLFKICDIAELIRQNQCMNWEWVVEEASKLGISHMLYFALMSTSGLLGTVIPKEISQKAMSFPKLIAKVTQVREFIFGTIEPIHRRPKLTKQKNLQFAVRRRLRDRLNPIFEYSFTPNKYDFMFLPLPRTFFPLYYFVRPIRLIYKYGRKLLLRVFSLTIK